MNNEDLVFISHKHADKNIASVVSQFITNVTLGNVKVFQSSDQQFEGPKFGGNINKALRKALWNCDILILIYTTETRDWAYCMWECGVATQPDSSDTKIIVFQCGTEAPAPFQADLRVNVQHPDDLKKFTKQLLTENIFSKGPLAPSLSETTLNKRAEDLQKAFQSVIVDIPYSEEWTAWPYMQIEIAYDQKDLVNSDVHLSMEDIESRAVISETDNSLSQLFGFLRLPEQFKLTELKQKWEANFSKHDYSWFDSCSEQILTGIKKELPLIRLATIKHPSTNAEFTPVLSRINRLPFENVFHCDFYFYYLSDPRAISVISKMITINDFFYKKIGKIQPADIKLRDLIKELKAKSLNRVPLLTDENHPFAIIHKSIIDSFVSDNI